MPRVLHVFATFTAAGPQVRTAELIRGLGDEFEHAVVAMDGRVEALELCPRGVRVLTAPAGLGAMRALLAREAPDLLCTYNWGAFDAALAARLERHLRGRRAHVHHEDGFNADEVVRRKRRRNLARRVALGRAGAVVVPSRLLEGIARREWHVPAARLRRIVNGVDLARFRPEGPGRAELRARLGIPRDALVVGAVGHLRPVKRYDRLLHAAAGLAGAHVLLVGEGPERAALEALVPACTPAGGGIHLVGHQRDLAPWYRAMDVLCVSSDSEQLPVTLLEAMACGLPACGTNVGDLAVTLPQEGRDLLVAPGEPGPLRDALAALLGDAERRRTLGRAAAARARRHYSLDAMVSAYRKVYRDVLG